MQRPTAPSRLLQLLLLLLLACPLPARAEMSAQLSLRGRVLDPHGAAVAGAQVTAEAKGRAAVYSATTDQNGEFLLAVAPGEYVVKVIAEGFSEASQTLNLSQESGTSLEVKLQVAGVREDVTVSAPLRYDMDAVSSATGTLTAAARRAAVGHRRDPGADQGPAVMSIGDVVRYVPGVAPTRERTTATRS